MDDTEIWEIIKDFSLSTVIFYDLENNKIKIIGSKNYKDIIMKKFIDTSVDDIYEFLEYVKELQVGLKKDIKGCIHFDDRRVCYFYYGDFPKVFWVTISSLEDLNFVGLAFMLKRLLAS